MINKPKVPERIWIHFVDNCDWAKGTFSLDKNKICDECIEYILKSVADKKVADATKHIREVYEKYTGSHIMVVGAILELDLWQAIKKTIKEDEEKAPN